MDTQGLSDCKTEFSAANNVENHQKVSNSSQFSPLTKTTKKETDSIRSENFYRVHSQIRGTRMCLRHRNLDNLLTHLIPVFPPPNYIIKILLKDLFI